MLASHKSEAEKASAGLLYGIGGVFTMPLGLISHWCGLSRVVHWVQDEWLRIRIVNELSRLNDHYLRDAGICRCEIRDIADIAVKQLRAERRDQGQLRKMAPSADLGTRMR